MNDLTGQTTDRKLLFLLGGGESLLRITDPEGLLSAGQPAMLAWNAATGQWSLSLHFPNGDAAVASGRKTPAGFSVEELWMPLPGNRRELIRMKPATTFLSALSPLDTLPARLKHCMRSAGGQGSAGTHEGWFDKYRAVTADALFWEVEDGDRKKTRDMFNLFNVIYQASETGQVSLVKMSSSIKTREGKITVSAEADVYGLSKKRVILEKNLGMNRSAVIDCRASKDGRTYPSLKVAFDLDSSIPVLYEKERRKKTGLGKPRAK